MVQTLSRAHKSWLQWLAPAAAVLVLAACEAPQRSADYRDQSKIAVGKETVSLTIAVPAAGAGLAGIEATKFEQFVRRYLEQGHGQISVQAAGAAAGLTRELLLKEGVRGREIVVAPDASGAANSVRLSYTASTVTPPECGDWSSNASFNWSNRVHSDFGCATRRNIGLTVQDPADLEKARDMSGADGERGAGVITNYRTAPAKATTKTESTKGTTKK